jgi:hypothetical protein
VIGTAERQVLQRKVDGSCSEREPVAWNYYIRSRHVDSRLCNFDMSFLILLRIAMCNCREYGATGLSM